MPRKAKSSGEQILDFLTELGVSPEEQKKIDQIREDLSKQQTDDERALEAEAVLLYFNTKGSGFTDQKCPSCGKVFAYKYYIPKHKMCCSNECRREALKKLGIIWTPNKTPEERWAMPGQKKGHDIPLVVPPAAFNVLQEIL